MAKGPKTPAWWPCRPCVPACGAIADGPGVGGKTTAPVEGLRPSGKDDLSDETLSPWWYSIMTYQNSCKYVSGVVVECTQLILKRRNYR